MSFYDDNIPEEIQNWHDYYQSIIADKEEEIKSLGEWIETYTVRLQILADKNKQLEVQIGNQKRDSTRTAGPDQQNGRENRFNSRCSRCGG